MNRSRLYIIRGVSGSGKSTLAKSLLEADPSIAHFEADMYFVQDGEYRFDPKLLPAAHRWCFEQVCDALLDGKCVIVSNTFTQVWELEKYLKLAERWPTTVFSMKKQYQNTHGVPADKVEAMRKRWEKIPADRVLFETEDDNVLIQFIK